MTGNKTSVRSWAYQASVGAEGINAATDTTYLFGFKDQSQDWKVPSMKTDVEEHHVYGSREPAGLTPLTPEYKPFITGFYPTTPQHLIWQLKQVVDAAPTHDVTVLDSGLPLPLTIRYEMNDGGVDRLFQAVDCYSIGLYWRAMYKDKFYVENEWMYGRLEDRRGQWLFDDTCAARAANSITLTDDADRTANSLASHLCYINGGDHENDEYNITANTDADPTVLTTTETTGASLAADTLSVWDRVRPKLTTAPVMPGYTATNAYMGTPEVYWDVGDENVALPECWKVECQHTQEYSTVPDTDDKYQITYLHKHNPIKLTLEIVCETHKDVYDYIDRKANDINVKVYKPNTNYYLLHKLTGCEIIDREETGHANKGHWNAKVFLKALAITGEFTLEAETNWSTHYKAV